MRELKFEPTEQTILQAWRQVKRDFFDHLQDNMIFILKRLFEASLEEEQRRFLEADWYEHAEERKGYRNGFTERDYFTEIGLVKGIRVPRVREEAYESEILPRYERMQEEILDRIAELYLAGVSTRRVEEVLALFLKGGVSATKVSEVTRRLDRELRAFHTRPLLDHYVYLFLDGIFFPIQSPEGKRTQKVLLVVYGVTVHGTREIVDFLLARSESQTAWEGFLTNLYGRGLKGENTELVIIDGGRGLRAGVELVYPRIPLQRCWAHKMRNIETYLRKKDREACLEGARLIYQAPNPREARKAFRIWKETWKGVYPKAVHCLEKDLEEMLTFFLFEEDHWRRVRTTNPIERLFREYRRRTRTMGCFVHGRSCERILFSITRYLNGKWGKKPVIQFHDSIPLVETKPDYKAVTPINRRDTLLVSTEFTQLS